MFYHQKWNSQSTNHYDPRSYRGTVWTAHFHQSMELIRVMTGKLTLTVESRVFSMEGGDYALVLPNELHAIAPTEDTTYFVAVFSSDFLPESVGTLSDKRAENPVFHCDGETDALFCAHLIGKKPSNWMIKACLYAVCDCFLQSVPLIDGKDRKTLPVIRALDYIAMNYRMPISLSDCAEHIGYEYHYLSRLLNKNYKIDFLRVLNRYRMDDALERLGGGACVTDAALDAGFQSVRTFYDAVKRETGQTPRDFLKSRKYEAQSNG